MRSSKYSHMSAFLSASLHTHARVCVCECVHVCGECMSTMHLHKVQQKSTEPNELHPNRYNKRRSKQPPTSSVSPLGSARDKAVRCGRRTHSAAYFVAQAENLFRIGETKF